MDARAYAPFQAEQAEHAAKLARRAEAAAASDKPPIWHRNPKTKSTSPTPRVGS